MLLILTKSKSIDQSDFQAGEAGVYHVCTKNADSQNPHDLIKKIDLTENMLIRKYNNLRNFMTNK